MTFGSKPISAPPFRPRPSTRTENAFAVGSRVLLTSTSGDKGSLPLLDEDGMPTGGHLPVDAPVVITAWKPRRSAPARYRVCSADRIEGWLDAANLRRIPPPPPPPPPPAPVVAAKPAKPVAKPAAKPVTKPAARVVSPAPTPARKPAAGPAARPQVAAKVKPAPRPAKPAPRRAKPQPTRAPAKKTPRSSRKRAR